MTERQQLAEAIRKVLLEPNEDGSTRRWYDHIDVLEARFAAVVEPFLVAAERAGYERCKRDAATRIEALPRYGFGGIDPDKAVAVVAALNATQHEAEDKAWRSERDVVDTPEMDAWAQGQIGGQE